MPNINMKYRKGTLIVEIKGRLEKFNAYKLDDYLVPVILKHNIKKLVYDTKYLTYIDTYGITVLKKGVKAIKENRGNIYYSKKSLIKNLTEGWYEHFKLNRRK